MKEIRIVCEESGGPLPYFVEVEDEQGRSFDAGIWRNRPDGMRELVLDLGDLAGLVLAEPAAERAPSEVGHGEGAKDSMTVHPVGRGPL